VERAVLVYLYPSVPIIWTIVTDPHFCDHTPYPAIGRIDIMVTNDWLTSLIYRV
jgi:hypothetical protein